MSLALIKCQVLGLEAQVLGLEAQVLGLEAQVLGLEAQVLGLETQVLGLETQVLGLETQVLVNITGQHSQSVRGELVSLPGQTLATQTQRKGGEVEGDVMSSVYSPGVTVRRACQLAASPGR